MPIVQRTHRNAFLVEQLFVETFSIFRRLHHFFCWSWIFFSFLPFFLVFGNLLLIDNPHTPKTIYYYRSNGIESNTAFEDLLHNSSSAIRMRVSIYSSTSAVVVVVVLKTIKTTQSTLNHLKRVTFFPSPTQGNILSFVTHQQQLRAKRTLCYLRLSPSTEFSSRSGSRFTIQS